MRFVNGSQLALLCSCGSRLRIHDFTFTCLLRFPLFVLEDTTTLEAFTQRNPVEYDNGVASYAQYRDIRAMCPYLHSHTLSSSRAAFLLQINDDDAEEAT